MAKVITFTPAEACFNRLRFQPCGGLNLLIFNYKLRVSTGCDFSRVVAMPWTPTPRPSGFNRLRFQPCGGQVTVKTASLVGVSTGCDFSRVVAVVKVAVQTTSLFQPAAISAVWWPLVALFSPVLVRFNRLRFQPCGGPSLALLFGCLGVSTGCDFSRVVAAMTANDGAKDCFNRLRFQPCGGQIIRQQHFNGKVSTGCDFSRVVAPLTETEAVNVAKFQPAAISAVWWPRGKLWQVSGARVSTGCDFSRVVALKDVGDLGESFVSTGCDFSRVVAPPPWEASIGAACRGEIGAQQYHC